MVVLTKNNKLISNNQVQMYFYNTFTVAQGAPKG